MSCMASCVATSNQQSVLFPPARTRSRTARCRSGWCRWCSRSCTARSTPDNDDDDDQHDDDHHDDDDDGDDDHDEADRLRVPRAAPGRVAVGVDRVPGGGHDHAVDDW